MRSILTFSLLICFSFCFSQHHVTLRVMGTPSAPANPEMYIAGSFNGWNPKNEQFKFRKDSLGVNSITLKLNPGLYEYKITRGGWDKVETSIEGKSIPNKQLKVDRDTLINIDIRAWQDQFTGSKASTASPQVKILTNDFKIPQLNRTRRIWIYLPEGYQQSGEKYPVLYMHDGQNLFEDTSSFSGEWGIDEYLDSVRSGKYIVIGIDNGGMQRLSEYAPYDFRLKTANSETKIEATGIEYVDFIVKTLKPYIDKTYRTKKDKKNTMIAGSSMGGLISMYAVVKYPKVFGGVGVFSPAFWTAPELFTALEKNGKKIRSNIYFYAGKKESEQMVPDMLKAMEILSSNSRSRIKTVIRDEGQHNEARWRVEFGEGLDWMRGR
jgi:predicted alpha/beta superfamily hydrolase